VLSPRSRVGRFFPSPFPFLSARGLVSLLSCSFDCFVGICFFQTTGKTGLFPPIPYHALIDFHETKCASGSLLKRKGLRGNSKISWWIPHGSRREP